MQKLKTNHYKSQLIYTKKLTKNNIFVRRPGGGDFKIKDLTKLYGKIVKKDIKNNIQIKKNFLK